MQQGLTTEAATIVKQAITLAKRRGHAQVTPLHVANAMLAVTNGLLRTACLQSHSHPLQCKALELCFNVALNRLPASTSSTKLSTHSHSPSISNALVAAFKRAQAQNRRGSVENQQQPVMKIEVEQLVVSILDDPSVSRVMKEAGFSSPQVKHNVQKVVSQETCSQSKEITSVVSQNMSVNTSSVSSKCKENNNLTLVSDSIRAEDIARVIDNLGDQRRRGIVIVGECLTSLEGVMRGVMDKVDKGDVCESLRGVKFISLSLSSLSHVSKVEVEHKIEELRSLVKNNSCNSKGYVLYIGDLEWVFEYRAVGSLSQHGRGYYCPVDHMIVEIGKLVSGVGECGRFWVMGIATFQAYNKRCESGYSSSLETVWSLHPITIPAGTLRLSLITDSGLQNQCISKKADNGTSWLLLQGGENDQKQPSCFAKFDCSSSTLPTWLQHYKNENRRVASNEVDEVGKFKELNSENLKTLCNALEEKVPWQKDIIPEIVSTILQCRSGMIRRKWNMRSSSEVKEETWLFFQGGDVEAKEKIAMELARLVFGSYKSFISISLSNFSSSTRSDSTHSSEECRNKRLRDERSCNYIKRFADEVSSNPHRVFIVEDIDQVDYCSQLGFKRAIERGRVEDSNGEEVGLGDAIIILSWESYSSSMLRVCSPSLKQKSCEGCEKEKDEVATMEDTSACVSLDLNISISMDDDCNEQDHSVDDIGLLESVDRRIIFKKIDL
ncbi:hypothetical protein RIF29_39663 [Crotalaria pallida]|uniref:Clp R domain-containing protein n=1 Tax=Crotalaria pallida TaxID=3830 RepID=A0AAN9E2F8_CROPI